MNKNTFKDRQKNEAAHNPDNWTARKNQAALKAAKQSAKEESAMSEYKGVKIK